MNRREATDHAVLAATLVAVAMIAQQVGGKAVRDALFLSNYAVTALPNAVIGAALFSIAWIGPVSHWMTRHGPVRVVPFGFALSAVLLLAEAASAARFPKVVAIAFYFHMAALAPVLISGFWSLINERFDPTTARRRVGRITAGATLGGVLGGLLAERTGAWGSVPIVFLALAALHLFCAWRVRALRPPHPLASQANPTEPEVMETPVSGWNVLRSNRYLRNLAALTLLGTIAAGLLDYAFKSQAAAAFEGAGREGQLLRFFAIFYTTVGTLTFVVQAILGSRFLEKFGLARTAAFLPGIVAGGGTLAILAPGLPVLALLRGAESVVRSSVYRSGYELLYTPLPASEKRSTKTLVDVGFDRLGDVLAGGLIKLALALFRGTPTAMLLVCAVVFAVASLWTTFRIGRQYVRVLERSLLARAVHLDPSDTQDSTTRSVLLHTLGQMPRLSGLTPMATPPSSVRRADDAPAPGPATKDRAAEPDPLAIDTETDRDTDTDTDTDADTDTDTDTEADTGIETGTGTDVDSPAAPPTRTDPVADLGSGDLRRVIDALAQTDTRADLVAHVIPLLAWDGAAEAALRWLTRAVPQHTGQLIDALLDPDQDFAVRRRIPRVFTAAPTERAIEGLYRGLEDRRFEVRLQCGRALAYIHKKMPETRWSRERIIEVVRRELRVERPIWKGRRLLDRDDRIAAELGLVDEALAARCDRSLEHVFTLLSLTFDAQPLRVAFRGLHTDDEMLRGTALEYLDTLLPADLRAALGILLDEPGGRRSATAQTKPAHDVLQALLESHESILINLEELRRARPPGSDPSAAPGN